MEDWESVTKIGKNVRGGAGANRETVIRGASALNAAKRSGGAITTEKKFASGNAVSQVTFHSSSIFTPPPRDPSLAISSTHNEPYTNPLLQIGFIRRRPTSHQSRPFRRNYQAQDRRSRSRPRHPRWSQSKEHQDASRPRQTLQYHPQDCK